MSGSSEEVAVAWLDLDKRGPASACAALVNDPASTSGTIERTQVVEKSIWRGLKNYSTDQELAGGPVVTVNAGDRAHRNGGYETGKSQGVSSMKQRLTAILAGAVLAAVAGPIHAACEDMRVIVRNSIYPIQGLTAFCTEFNKMKADLAGMKSELSIARQENRVLKSRLARTPVATGDESWVLEIDGLQAGIGQSDR